MRESTSVRYGAHEFAERAGVTVRTLHHYDRLGLLKPEGRTAAGYRLYGERSLARLQQIVTLKFIGLPLKRIAELLDRREFDLAGTLRLQRAMIEEQRRRLDTALRAIGKAERIMASGGAFDWETFKQIIEVIDMQKNMDWTEKYYSAAAREKLAARRAEITVSDTMQETVEQGQRDWAALISEVEAAVKAGEDPAGERARALASRWEQLIEAFTGGDSAIREGLNKLYADKANWPATFTKPYSDEVGAFIRQAVAARHEK